MQSADQAEFDKQFPVPQSVTVCQSSVIVFRWGVCVCVLDTFSVQGKAIADLTPLKDVAAYYNS